MAGTRIRVDLTRLVPSRAWRLGVCVCVVVCLCVCVSVYPELIYLALDYIMRDIISPLGGRLIELRVLSVSQKVMEVSAISMLFSPLGCRLV